MLAHRPQRDIDQVYAPVRHLAACVVPEPAEVVDTAVRVVGSLRRGTEPEVPVQAWGRVAVGRVADAVGRLVAHIPAVNRRDFAQPARAHDLDGFLEMLAAALLQSNRDDALVFAGGMHHRQPLGNIVHRGLLAQHMLARLAGVNSHFGVPVVRRGDDHRVDVRALQNAPIVGVRLDIGASCEPAELV